ncbi:MAG: tRNA (adenosine(37)-N6)-threonylcarbamoyltransferase complex ATPase subunit type 1 TsaE [Candidatus Pacebacteria bacterium]|nr:tRNA (adenosine(37)-N6)-threonylcarbamoyltransferase complex ATPase subunit type 1 TsaE [Candidatus Paceibacterota bacterium]
MNPKTLISSLQKKDRAVVIGLFGNLGAGKTTFTKGVAKELGITEEVTSPTFVIQKTYDIPIGDFERLVHIDAYRLESGEDLKKIGFLETLKDPENLIFIEWPENVMDILPKEIQELHFQFDGEDRKISYGK